MFCILEERMLLDIIYYAKFKWYDGQLIINYKMYICEWNMERGKLKMYNMYFH